MPLEYNCLNNDQNIIPEYGETDNKKIKTDLMDFKVGKG